MKRVRFTSSSKKKQITNQVSFGNAERVSFCPEQVAESLGNARFDSGVELAGVQGHLDGFHCCKDLEQLGFELAAGQNLDLYLAHIRRVGAPVADRWLFDAQGVGQLFLAPEVLESVCFRHAVNDSSNYHSKNSSGNRFSLAGVDTSFMETIGARVTALRKSKRLSQRALADACEVSQPTIANIERGRTTEVKGYVLEALARELNTSTTYLLEGAEDEDGHEADMRRVELVAIFQRLSEADQEALLRAARGMFHFADPKPSNMSPFPAKERRTEAHK